ncbi:hypothetical protein ACVWZV_006119 [Bradyrhizobium sp. GM5.1]
MDGEFKNEVFSSYAPNPARSCNACGKRMRQLHSLLDTTTGKTVRIFKCECGEQMWSEGK